MPCPDGIRRRIQAKADIDIAIPITNRMIHTRCALGDCPDALREAASIPDAGSSQVSLVPRLIFGTAWDGFRYPLFDLLVRRMPRGNLQRDPRDGIP